MDPFMIAAVTFIAYFVVKTLLMNDLSAEKAGRLVKEGAVIVDVRTEDEYKSAHLKNAINVPLNDITNQIGRLVPDRNRVLLLHCRSGSRSFMGKRILKRMKYDNVYNLGSFGRAKRMVSDENHG